MAKKNFKGGLDSLIENSLGMRKSGKKGEMKGNPIDLAPEQTDSDVLPALKVAPQKNEEKKAEADTQAVADTTDTQIVTKAETKPENAEAKPAEVASESKAEPDAAAKTETAAESKAPEAPKPADEEAKPVAKTEAEAAEEQKPVAEAKPVETPEVIVGTKIKAPTLEVEANDSEKNIFLKNLVADLRKELYLWRNGKLNIQNFNASLHANGLKYNPVNNEIEEM